jgi:hypothetical protein
MDPKRCRDEVRANLLSTREIPVLKGFMTPAIGFRTRALKISLLFLSAIIGLLPVSASGATSCIVVHILLGGSGGADITDQTESPWYVGKQTVLYASYTLPSGISVANQSWSVPGTTVGGFDHLTSGGQSANFNGQSTTFYWTVPASSKTVTVSVDFSNGTSSTAQATFDVSGPTSPSVTHTFGSEGWEPLDQDELSFGYSPLG